MFWFEILFLLIEPVPATEAPTEAATEPEAKKEAVSEASPTSNEEATSG